MSVTKPSISSESDSDATWPATDDFGSRFLEVDEYEQVRNTTALPRFRSHRNLKSARPDNPIIKQVDLGNRRGLRRKRFLVLEDDTDTNDDNSLGSSRSAGKKSCAPSSSINQILGSDEDSGSEGDKELFTFRNPRLMTARQLSLKMQRNASSGGQAVPNSHARGLSDSVLLTLESLEPPKATNKPTPEQILARQQRIARRRESAKRKAEMEKQQTVERLLKINANSVGLPKRGRGRRRGTNLRLGSSHTESTTQLNSADPNGSDENEDAEEDEVDERTGVNDDNGIDGVPTDANDEHGRSDSTERATRLSVAEQRGLTAAHMDLRPGYIRWLSSSRLTPTNRVCLSPGSSMSLFSAQSHPRDSPIKQQLCALGCGRARRYTCSFTGRPLCSLLCYRQNMEHMRDASGIGQLCA